MKPLVVIPARAGSKGLPGKNHKILNGKPLIRYTLDIALELFERDEICVSTDSDTIVKISNELGIKIPFIRPKHLADDDSSMQDVMIHALNFWEKKYFIPDCIILLQPTSPFRSKNQILDCLSIYESSFDMVISINETKKNPYFILRQEDKNGFLQPSLPGDYTRRQDCPIVYELNGAIYVINPKSLKEKKIISFKKVRKYVMDFYSSIDIDDELDFLFAEFLLEKKNYKNKLFNI